MQQRIAQQRVMRPVAIGSRADAAQHLDHVGMALCALQAVHGEVARRQLTGIELEAATRFQPGFELVALRMQRARMVQRIDRVFGLQACGAAECMACGGPSPGAGMGLAKLPIAVSLARALGLRSTLRNGVHSACVASMDFDARAQADLRSAKDRP